MESYEKVESYRKKSGELRIATPNFRNSPLIFKLMNGEVREVLTLHFYCQTVNIKQLIS